MDYFQLKTDIQVFMQRILVNILCSVFSLFFFPTKKNVVLFQQLRTQLHFADTHICAFAAMSFDKYFVVLLKKSYKTLYTIYNNSYEKSVVELLYHALENQIYACRVAR